MVVMTLESLVLSGVSVLCGGETVELRLGTEYANRLQAPSIGHPMPHPMPAPAALTERADWQPCCSAAGSDFADSCREDARGAGIGRSQGHAGGSIVAKPLSISLRSTAGFRTSSTASPTRELVPGKLSEARTPPSGGLTGADTVAA